MSAHSTGMAAPRRWAGAAVLSLLLAALPLTPAWPDDTTDQPTSWKYVSAALQAAETMLADANTARRAALVAEHTSAAELQEATESEAALLLQQAHARDDLGRYARALYISGQPGQATVASQSADPLSVLEKANAARARTEAAIVAHESAVAALDKANLDYALARQFFHRASVRYASVFGGVGAVNFSDGDGTFPGVDAAIERAYSFVGHAEDACSDGHCYRLCDHLAGKIWGHAYSGYDSARVHWNAMVANGLAHPGDPHPPVGALLFWETGEFGHVATYVGDGLVVTNMKGDQGNNVYLVPAAAISKSWNVPYLGWAPPVFRGPRINP